MKQFLTAICVEEPSARGSKLPSTRTDHVGVPLLILNLDIIQTNVEESKERVFRNDHARRRPTETDWSTDLRTPVIIKSFFSSTMTVWSVSVLNTEKIS
jgi:hypothetical protein